MTFSYTKEEFDHAGELFTLELECECHPTPYDPGRTSGPPELCYPPEGGYVEDMTVLEVHAEDAEGTIVSGNTLDFLAAQVQADIADHGPLCQELEEYAADLAAEEDRFSGEY